MGGDRYDAMISKNKEAAMKTITLSEAALKLFRLHLQERRTIDVEAIPMLVNEHRLNIYKKPLSKQEFIEYIKKKVLVVEQVSASTPPTH